MKGGGQLGWGDITAGDAVVGSTCMKAHNDYSFSCDHPGWN